MCDSLKPAVHVTGNVRICRIECVASVHSYAVIGMLIHEPTLGCKSPGCSFPGVIRATVAELGIGWCCRPADTLRSVFPRCLSGRSWAAEQAGPAAISWGCC